jgi:nitrite reductase/ring-hydroxylating ferredoxin subunit
VVECPWHGSRFCLRDGRVLTGPATVNAPRYAVRVRDGQVEVKRIGDR